jgi:hypothetical protein
VLVLLVLRHLIGWLFVDTYMAGVQAHLFHATDNN